MTGVHSSEGLTTGDVDEAAMKRALARRAADTYVLASAEKIGVSSRCKVLPLDEIAGIITDQPQNDQTLRELRRNGTSIIYAYD
jgi:DeoR/GlpR family transcriptional regulator of sugar metabolism